MVTAGYHDFFLAVASAAGALVGLLFVAISVSADRLWSSGERVQHQVRASSALTATLTPLIIALTALIPQTNVGWIAIVVGVLGTLFTAGAVRRFLADARAHDRKPRLWSRSVGILWGFFGVMLTYLVAGSIALAKPASGGAVTTITVAMIVSLSIGVDRAWELVGAPRSGLAASLHNLVGRAQTEEPR